MSKAKLKLVAEDKTQKGFSSARAGLKKLAGRVGGLGAAVAAVAGAAGLGALVKKTFETADATAKVADKIGITTKALGGLRHAAELTGVSQNTLDQALQRVTRRIAEAANGTGEAKDALRELGIDAEKLVKHPLQEQLGIVADKMGNVETRADKVRLAMKLFDSEGVALVNTLDLGSEGLKEIAAEADAFGISMSRVDAAKIEAANDAITRSKARFTGVVNVISAKLAPVVQFVIERFSGLSDSAKDFGNIMTGVIGAGVTVFARFTDVLQGLRFAFAGLKVLAAGFIGGFITGIAELDKFVVGLANQLVSLGKRALIPIIELAGNFSDTAKDAAKSLSNFKFEPIEQLDRAAQATFSTMEKLKGEMDAIALEGLPGDKLISDFDKFIEKAEEAARKVAETKNSVAAAGGQSAGEGADLTDDAAQGQQQTLDFGAAGSFLAKKREEERLGVLKESYASELEMLANQNLLKIEAINEFRELELLSDQEHKALLIEQEESHFNKLQQLAKTSAQGLAALWKQGIKGKLAATQIYGEQLVNAFGGQSKKLFHIQKALAISMAVMNTAQGVTSALATQDYAGAAIIALAGGLQIAKIASTEFNGGGSSVATPSGGGSSSSASGASAANSISPIEQDVRGLEEQNLNLTIITRGRDGREEAIEIVKNIRELQEEGEPIFAGAN